LAALASLKLTGLLSQRDVTLIQNPGAANQTLIVKQGQQIKVVHLSGQNVAGQGTKVGSVYRLSDGRLVYVTGK
jgi:hypothetical protein